MSADSLYRNVQAQNLIDDSLGAEGSVLDSQGSTDFVTGGAVRGSGLFHSFEVLEIAEGRSLYFIQPDGISKIFSRVTGNGPSNILGTLGVQKNGVQGNADLYLLNPNGIILGPNAQLDLGGSFFASTADSLRFGEDEFQAIAPAPAPLLMLNVDAGIQFGNNAPNRLIQNQANLTLASAQQLSFDAGGIEQAGQINIPMGTVILRGESLSIPGPISTRTADDQFGVLRLSSPVDLTIGATEALTNDSLGKALVENAVVVESDGRLSLIGPLTSNSNTPLTFSAADDLNLLDDGTATVSRLAGNLTLQSGGSILWANPFHISVTQGSPEVKVQAVGNVQFQPEAKSWFIQVTGAEGILSIEAEHVTVFEGGVFTSANGLGTGPTIDISVNQDFVLNGNIFSTLAQNGQTAGNLNIQAGERILLRSGFLQSYATNADAGDINLSARNIILDGSQGQSFVITQTALQSAGNAGNVTLNASESIELIGDQPGPYVVPDPSQVSLDDIILQSFGRTTIHATAFGSGESGRIEINTDQLKLRDGAFLANAVGLVGDSNRAGDVVINANDIQAKGLAVIATGTFGSADAGRLEINSNRIQLEDGAILGVSTVFGTGNAGEIFIETDDLVVSSGSIIAANTDGLGNAGRLEIDAKSITVEGSSSNGSFPSVLVTDAFPNASGAGGDIQIQTETLQVLNGGQIRTSTQGPKAAGNLKITAGQVLLSGTSPDGTPSTLEAQSTGTGAAGILDVQADNLTIRDRAQATTESQLGDGGDILLSLDDFLLLRQQGRISATAGSANTLGDGGNITIDAGFVIAPPTENSDITADAFEGTGGNVTITTDGVFGIQPQAADTPNSDITASSELGIAGAVRIDRLTSSPADTLVRLPDRLLKPEDEIAQGCPSDKNARFVITGRGGLPENPQAQLLRHPGLEDWREKLPRPPLPNRFEFSVSSPRQPSVPPSEAQGMQRDRYGKVHLLASPPNYHARWSALLANCGGKAG